MTMKHEWHVIGRGWAGWHAQGVNVSSSGGWLEAEGTYMDGRPRPAGYLAEAINGCLVYDAETADETAFSRLILSGPMCDPGLKPDGWKPFLDQAAAGRMAPHMAGQFATLATAAETPTYRGLDYVGVARYRALLATVPGIKIGTVRNGVIVWDDVPTSVSVTAVPNPER